MTKSVLTKTVTAALFAASILAGTTVSAASRNEINAFQAASFSIHDAISAVENKTGGKGFNAGFYEKQGGRIAGYEVEVLMADGIITQWYLDSQGGDLVAANVQSYADLSPRKQEKRDEGVAYFNSIQATIHDAINAVEAQSGGKAMSADFTEALRNGESGYYVEVLLPDGKSDKWFAKIVQATITLSPDN